MNSGNNFLVIYLSVIGIVLYTQFIKPIRHKLSEDKRLVEAYKQRRQVVELLAKVLKKDIAEVETWSNEKLLDTYDRYIEIMKMHNNNPEKFIRVANEVINKEEQKTIQQSEQVSKQMIIDKLSEVLDKDIAEIEQWEDEKILNTFNTYLELLCVQKYHPEEIEEFPYNRVQDGECPF